VTRRDALGLGIVAVLNIVITLLALDTNVLARLLLRDDAAQYKRARALLASDQQFTAPVTVLLELASSDSTGRWLAAEPAQLYAVASRHRECCARRVR
jgi:predicted nucleic acid-binding protein